MKVEVLDCPAAEGRGFPCSCGFIHFVGWDWKGSNNNVSAVCACVWVDLLVKNKLSVVVCLCVGLLVVFVLWISSRVFFWCALACVLPYLAISANG